jgi:casein kinase II subunit beta
MTLSTALNHFVSGFQRVEEVTSHFTESKTDFEDFSFPLSVSLGFALLVRLSMSQVFNSASTSNTNTPTMQPGDDQYSDSEETDSSSGQHWIDSFLSQKGHEFFCEIDQDFLTDRFNLTGILNEIPNYNQVISLVIDQPLSVTDYDDEDYAQLEAHAKIFYGLVHSRYIITSRGLARMMEKYKQAHFGKCPRVFCQSQALLPVALTDVPFLKSVKMYCPKCEDIYTPKNQRHHGLDGAYFGTSFAHMFFQAYPQLYPKKSTERYIPKIFGFRLRDFTKAMSQPNPMLSKQSSQTSTQEAKNEQDDQANNVEQQPLQQLQKPGN